jgi:protein involved in polysaccharide export with SLBB domain
MKSKPHHHLTIGALTAGQLLLLSFAVAFATPPTDTGSATRPGVSNEVVTATVVAPNEKHPLAIGDQLSFRIQEDLEDPKESREPKSLVVTDSGEIEVPYIGRVCAESKTCGQLAAEIKTALEKEYYYRATVTLALDLRAKTRGRVYLVGPVRAPGAQDIPTDETLTVSKAIMRAGGFTDFADRKNVKVTRRGGPGAGDQTFVIDVAQILDKGKTDRDLPLEPGDLIVIPERAIRF